MTYFILFTLFLGILYLYRIYRELKQDNQTNRRMGADEYLAHSLCSLSIGLQGLPAIVRTGLLQDFHRQLNNAISSTAIGNGTSIYGNSSQPHSTNGWDQGI